MSATDVVTWYPSRRSHSRLRRCTSEPSHRLSTTTTGAQPVSRTSTDSRTALIAPSPASATSTTTSGERAVQRSTLSPSAAMGDRGPPAVSTSPTAVSAGQASSVTRSSTL